MSKLTKILIAVVVVLVLVGISFFVWNWSNDNSYYAIYLRTGDLYFGHVVHFPSFGLQNVYTIQVNAQNQQNPLSIQKFTNIFWGPEDYMSINRANIVWMVKLNSAGQLAQLLKTNPELTSTAATQQPAPTPATPATPAPSTNK